MCCGSLGKNESSLKAHSKNRNTTNTDATDLSESSVRSFSIPIATKRLLTLSYKESKALAFHSLVRALEQSSNNHRSYTINALHVMTGVHAKTIEDRLLTLERMGLIDYDEKHRIILKRAKAKHKEHNSIIVIKITNSALKDAESSFLTARVANKIRQINYHRDVLNQYHKIMSSRHRGSLKEIKSLKNWLREHCKQDYRTHSFVNYGWSYKSISKYLGVSIAKAINVIKYAVENKLITKRNNFMFIKLSHCSQIDYIQHTFSYHGYSYKVWANTYDMATGTIR